MPNISIQPPIDDSIRNDDVSKDEYDISLEQEIDDETLLENPGPRKFLISSYGADYTVDSLVKRMRGGAFKVPKFQRKFVWTLKHSSKCIESLLMGLPIPGVFLYKDLIQMNIWSLMGSSDCERCRCSMMAFSTTENLGSKAFERLGKARPMTS